LHEATLTLTESERERLWVLKARGAGKLRAKEAAEQLGVSERQLRRLMRKFAARGDAAAVHGLKGRPGNRATPVKDRQRILRLYENRYSDYGPTLFAERLEERHGIKVSRETLRGWLVAAGRWKARIRRRERHPWRERRPRFGELVQLDSSQHDWFESGEKVWLVAAIDDATSVVFGLFASGDTVFANFDVIRSWVESHGRPLAFYVDRHTHFSVKDDEGCQRSETTQIGRALDELQIEMISAYTPQAKGRVERLFGTLQDRLVKELRERGIRTIEEANRFLVTTFWPAYNAKFARPARDPHGAHRPLTGEQRRKLGYVFSWREDRTLRPDETIQYDRRHFLLETRGAARLRPGRKVEVLLSADGSLRVVHQGRDIGFRELPARPSRAVRRKVHPGRVLNLAPSWTPPKTHPWRQAAALATAGLARTPSGSASAVACRGEGAARSPSAAWGALARGAPG